MAEPAYCSLQLEYVIKYISLQLLHDELPLMKKVLPVSLHLDLLSVIKNFLQILHLLHQIIARLHLMLFLGYKEGATISFRFLLCL